jgi:hypothetical protein
MNVFQGAFFLVGRGFDNLWPPLSSCFRLRKKTAVFETSCACSALYVILRRWKKSFYLLVMCYNLLLCQKFPWCSYLVLGKYIILTVYTVLISKGVYLLDKIEGLLFDPSIHKIIRAVNPFRSEYGTGSAAVVSGRRNLPNTWNKQAAGRVQLKCDDTRWRTGGEVKGKLVNGLGSQYPSHYLGTWCIQHYYRWCAQLGCQ